MASYWPTLLAIKNDPVVAARMNDLPKVVFSRTLDKASWKNTKLVKDGLAASIRKMKQQPGNDMVIFGSGSIIAQLAAEHLIDEYQIVLNPVALGAGRTMFEGDQREARFEVDKVADLQERQCLSVLRAEGMNLREIDEQARSTADAVARRSYGKLVAGEPRPQHQRQVQSHVRDVLGPLLGSSASNCHGTPRMIWRDHPGLCGIKWDAFRGLPSRLISPNPG